MRQVTQQEARATFNELYMTNADDSYMISEIFGLSKEEALKKLEEKTIFELIRELSI